MVCELGTAGVLGRMDSVLSVCSVYSGGGGGRCGCQWQTQAAMGENMEIMNT